MLGELDEQESTTKGSIGAGVTSIGQGKEYIFSDLKYAGYTMNKKRTLLQFSNILSGLSYLRWTIG